ncbi:hypothetical protein DXG01_002158 [Tephrocybe rancida]|nr:hypothetical protein DXG01_002158 [Tephrocybe rancida]
MHELPTVHVPLLKGGLDATCYSNHAVKAAAYAEIQLNIVFINRTLVELKMLHNSLSIIGRLPPEILSRVFSWLPPAPLIKASSTCTYWRKIALSSPDLWAAVEPRLGLEYLRTVIPRSRDHPLIVSHWGLNLGFVSTKLILQQMHRVRELSFDHLCAWNSSCSVDKIARELTASYAPILESFDLRVCNGRQDRHLSTNAFSTGSIHKIRLANCIFSPSGTLRHLTELTLEDMNNTGPEFSTVWEILQNSPNLEHLALRNAFQVDPDSTVVHLRHLRSLEIKCNDFETVLTTYSYINHSATIRIQMASSITREPYTDFSEVAYNSGAALSAHVVVRHACIKARENILTLSLSGVEDTSDMDAEVGIVLEFPQVEGHTQTFINSFCAGLRLAQVRHLSTEDIDFPQRIWCSVFGRLEFLTTLSIYNTGFELLDVLSDNLAHDGTVVEQGGALGWPALRALALHGWIVDQETIPLVGSRFGIRATKGARLQTLSLFAPNWVDNTSMEMLETWQQSVERIKLDGVITFGDANGALVDDENNEYRR